MKYYVKKLFFSKETEERWLNRYTYQRYRLIGVKGFTYIFEDNKSARETYRIERMDRRFEDNSDYIKKLKSSHVEIITHKHRWLYLRKPIEYGGFNLYSDIKNRYIYTMKYQNLASFITFLTLIAMSVFGRINLLFTGFIAPFFIISLIIFIRLFMKRWVLKQSMDLKK